MSSKTELRQQLATHPNCELVSADVFLERLTGHEQLIRSDEPLANLLGLLDEATGQRFLTPAEDFHPPRALLQVS